MGLSEVCSPSSSTVIGSSSRGRLRSSSNMHHAYEAIIAESVAYVVANGLEAVGYGGIWNPPRTATAILRTVARFTSFNCTAMHSSTGWPETVCRGGHSRSTSVEGLPVPPAKPWLFHVVRECIGGHRDGSSPSRNSRYRSSARQLIEWIQCQLTAWL